MSVPALIEIVCVTKSGNPERHKCIDSVGIRHLDDTIRIITPQDATLGIRKGNWIFFAEIDGQDDSVTVTEDSDGNEFLSTLDDSDQPNGLLKLPPCS